MTESIIKRNDNFIFRKVVNEMILVPIKQDVAEMEYIFTLNEVGAFVWEKLNESLTLRELQKAVMDEFDVDSKTAEKDLLTFLDELDRFEALERS